MLPELAKLYLPLLVATTSNVWPDAPQPYFMAGQVEQETCARLTDSKCWNPRAELKTSREYGFGLGQITRAYTATGALRFDKFQELKDGNRELRGWLWSDRYDPGYQLKALVLMNKSIYTRMSKLATSQDDAIRFTLSAYNGGESALTQDRLKCVMTPMCKPGVWVGNVAETSYKARQPVAGYAQSFFQINRTYVHNVMDVRRAKYAERWNN